MRLPKLFLNDDHAGKVIGIDLFNRQATLRGLW